MLPKEVTDVAAAIADAGGRAMVVGGWVRDRLLGHDSKDIDIEVYDLPLAELEDVLASFGEVVTVGRAFGVLMIKGLDVDFSLPRKDSKVGVGHRGFTVEFDPGLEFAEAARRRDLTINSMGLDPLTGETVDAHGGREDLRKGILRATDPVHFCEDPLRAVRVAQFAARFDMQPDDELVELCAALDLSELPAERLFEEFRKLLLKGKRPSVGFEVLRAANLIHFFPELEALIDVPQDPVWHPEGDVWVHTMMVIDEAAKLRDGGGDDLALMFGALCHDLGKPETTVEENGRIKSPGHDHAGLKHVDSFLGQLCAPNELVTRVKALVEHHLAPALFANNGATAKGYRRLARKLGQARVTMELLTRVARADHLGRTTTDALQRIFPAGDSFLLAASELQVEREGPEDVVMGRHLIARGMQPGIGFRDILVACREVQDETGWDDPERILDRALEQR